MARIETLELPMSQLGRQFLNAGTLNLCSRPIVIADNRIQQFWLPKPGLFGTRNRLSGNHRAVLDFFQLLSFDRIDDRDANPAKTNLLASLLPNVRSNRSQDIFPDASIAPPPGCSVTPGFDSEELESQLRDSKHERISFSDFWQRNREPVEFLAYPEATFDLYRDFEHELFADATSRWWDDPVSSNIDSDRHLFHGLVLGLHPAFGMLINTDTGLRLVGGMIAAEDIAAQERFLHAGLVSLYLYAMARRFRCSVVS